MLIGQLPPDGKLRKKVKESKGAVQFNDMELFEIRPSDDVHNIIKKQSEKVASENGGKDESHTTETMNMPPIGTRVRRGPDWGWDNHDDNLAGTVIAHKARGHLIVEWDNGNKGKYRYGAESGAKDVRMVDEPRILPPGMMAAVGCRVRRGADWEWDSQDGGEGSTGVIFKIEDIGVFHVRWDNGKRGNYRYGLFGKYDLEICSESIGVEGATDTTSDDDLQPTAQSKQKQMQWQDKEGRWRDHYKVTSDGIEHFNQTHDDKETVLIETDGDKSDAVTMATDPRAQHYVECTQCNRNAEYYCNTCTDKLCTKCKKKHQVSHASKHHDVVIYREKQTSVTSVELCQKHADLPYIMCCQQCEIPVCQKCIKEEHKKHSFVDIDVIFESKREEFESQVSKIKEQILPKYRSILADVQGDSTKCREEIDKIQSTMALKAQTLKDLIDTVLDENTDFLELLENSIMSELREQENIVSDRISELQNIVDEYEKIISENKHASFVQFQQDNQIKNLEEIPSLPEINIPSFVDNQAKHEDVVRLLGEIKESTKPATTRKITNANQTEKKSGTTAIPSVAKITSFTVPGVRHADHVSPVTGDRVWVSDIWGNLVLANVKGEKLNDMKYPGGLRGCHSTSATGEFFTLIENKRIVYKVTNDYEKLPCMDISPGLVYSIYVSPIDGDILVGRKKSDESSVIRYKSTGQEVHKIQYDKAGKLLYGNPRYLTENRKKRDVCVSDPGKYAVVVVDKDGNYRFSYGGHPSGSRFRPYGITSDLQGHILVSDYSSQTVQMIDQDGSFISFLLTTDHGIIYPSGLNLDVKNNALWVGEEVKNTISVYKYIQN